MQKLQVIPFCKAVKNEFSIKAVHLNILADDALKQPWNCKSSWCTIDCVTQVTGYTTYGFSYCYMTKVYCVGIKTYLKKKCSKFVMKAKEARVRQDFVSTESSRWWHLWSELFSAMVPSGCRTFHRFPKRSGELRNVEFLSVPHTLHHRTTV